MKSIREQIEDKCIHFNGLMNMKCKLKIAYHDVADMSGKPFKFPCIKNSALFGSHCDKVEFPDKDYVDNELKEIGELINKTFS